MTIIRGQVKDYIINPLKMQFLLKKIFAHRFTLHNIFWCGIPFLDYTLTKELYSNKRINISYDYYTSCCVSLVTK